MSPKEKICNPLSLDSLKPGDSLVIRCNCIELDKDKMYVMTILSKKKNSFGPTFKCFIFNENKYDEFHCGWFYGWHHYDYTKHNKYEVYHLEKL